MLKEIKREISQPYMNNLRQKVKKDQYRIPKGNPFRVLEMADLRDINMVIIGQDPYSNGIIEDNEFKFYYDGIAFSSSNTKRTPYSLKMLHRWFIKTEEARGHTGELTNDLSYLVERGILLINVVWSVSYNRPLSHAYPEWYMFTAELLKIIQNYNQDVVFLLLGKEAQRMLYAIRNHKYVFEAQHPASSRYKGNKKIYDSDILLRCTEKFKYPIRLLK